MSAKEEASKKGSKEVEKFYEKKGKKFFRLVGIAILFILAVFLLTLIRSWKHEQKEKTSASKSGVWYLSYSEPPGQRKNVKALDSGFLTCSNLENSGKRMYMVCRSRYGFVEVFEWDKVLEDRGKWHRKGDSTVGGEFYFEPDENQVFRGEITASDGVTKTPALLYKLPECEECE